MAEEFTRAVVNALATHLLSGVSGVAAVYKEWPDKNQALLFPSISLLSQEPRFKRCAPYMHSQGVLIPGTATSLNTYVIGHYDVPVQVDIWARNKPERATILDRFIQVVQPIALKGLCLQLTDYHNVWTAFSMLGYRWIDDEKAPSTQEWRATIQMEVNCKALRTTTEYVITNEPELVFTTPNEIIP